MVVQTFFRRRQDKEQHWCLCHSLGGGTRTCVVFQAKAKRTVELHLGGSNRSITKSPNLFVFLQLRVVDLSDLGEFGSVVGMFNGVVGRPAGSRGCSCGGGRSAAFLRARHALCQQHVVQPHELGVRGVLLLGTADAETCRQHTHTQTGTRGQLLQEGWEILLMK